LHSTKWSDGKKKISSLQNNLIQDSEGKEENGYPVWTPTKQRKMTPRNPTMSTRSSSKKKSSK
jgi:hypothetical protein